MAWKLPIGPAELDAGLGVLDRAVEAALGPAHLLGGQGHRRQVEGLGQAGLGPALGPDQPGRGVGELEPGLLAGLVHGGAAGCG